MERRSTMDFTEHELIVFQDKNILTHELKHPEYDKCLRIKFINTNDIMVVIGDFGNWIFCREFHPNKDTGVSDYYWVEKLMMYSVQEAYDYDPDGTESEVLELIESKLDEYGYQDDELFEAKEWYSNLLNHTENENDYTYHAYFDYDKPNFIEDENIPFEKKIKLRLLIVFDAFDEICSRLEK